MMELIEGHDYEVVDEGLGGVRDYLEQTSRNAFLRFAGLIDQATSGRRGKYATIALNMAGVTTDQQGISNLYRQHPDVIDQYFQYVNIVALSKKMEVDQVIGQSAPVAILKSGGLLATGIIIGVAGMRLYNRKK